MFDMGPRFYWRRALATVLAIAVGVIRPWLVNHEVNKHQDQSYQFVAHGLVVGLLVSAWWGGRKWDGFRWAVYTAALGAGDFAVRVFGGQHRLETDFRVREVADGS